MSDLVPCSSTPGKSVMPERPSCEHGPMLSNGDNWLCRDRRTKRYLANPEKSHEYVRAWRANPENRERERQRERDRYASKGES